MTRMDEVKNVPAIRVSSAIVAHNLLETYKEKPTLEEMPYQVDLVAGVYFGKYAGTLVVNDKACSNCCQLGNKQSVEGDLMCWLRGQTCGGCKYNSYNNNMGCMGCCLNYVYCC